MKKSLFFIALIAFYGLNEVYCQWNTNGNHIYNTNSGFVGIATSANNPCTIELGVPWRIPTLTKWENYKNIFGWIDWNLPWSSPLMLHAAGSLVK